MKMCEQILKKTASQNRSNSLNCNNIKLVLTQFKEISDFNKKQDLNWTMNGLEKPFRKNQIKNRKTAEMNVKMHVNKTKIAIVPFKNLIIFKIEIFCR